MWEFCSKRLINLCCVYGLVAFPFSSNPQNIVGPSHTNDCDMCLWFFVYYRLQPQKSHIERHGMQSTHFVVVLMECVPWHFILWSLFSSQQVKTTHSNCGTFRKQYLPRSECLVLGISYALTAFISIITHSFVHMMH